MNETLQIALMPAQHPARREDVAASLAQCGDVLTVHELSRVIGRSERTIRAEEFRGTFPIPRVDYGGERKHRPRKYLKVSVQRFLDRAARKA